MLARTDEFGNQGIGLGVGTSAAVLEMQTGLLGHVSHEILRVIPNREPTQCHDFHEGVGSFFDSGLVFDGIDWVHRVLVHWG